MTPGKTKCHINCSNIKNLIGIDYRTDEVIENIIMKTMEQKLVDDRVNRDFIS